MSKQFDLEQEILGCWSIVDALETLSKRWDDLQEDEKLNIILGIQALYNLRFETCFDTFEEFLKERN